MRGVEADGDVGVELGEDIAKIVLAVELVVDGFPDFPKVILAIAKIVVLRFRQNTGAVG